MWCGVALHRAAGQKHRKAEKHSNSALYHSFCLTAGAKVCRPSPSMTFRALSLVVLAIATRSTGADGAGATEVNGDMAILELKRLQASALPGHHR